MHACYNSMTLKKTNVVFSFIIIREMGMDSFVNFEF